MDYLTTSNIQQQEQTNNNLKNNHSTILNNDFRINLNTSSSNTWKSFENELLDTHLWLETFMLNVQTAHNARGKTQRLTVTELMKTPGRKRVGTNTTNSNSKKDPIATMLFPSAPPLTQSKSLPITSTLTNISSNTSSTKVDKENQQSGLTSSRIPSPARMAFSPASKGKGRAVMSPLRDSPRMIRPPTTSSMSTVFSIEKVAVTVQVSPTKMVVEEEEKDDEILDEELPVESEERQIMEVDDEKANLSMIGEEEEVDESSNNNSTQSLAGGNTSIVVPETQFPSALPKSPLSSKSVVHSHLQDTDLDTDVPLNDAPSNLRNPLSSSLPASANNNNATRTPGGTTISRFAPSSYSAHKASTTSGITSSSPPQASTASISSVMNGGARPSNSGRLVGGATLNFVGLSKKSLGMGMGMNFGRSVGSLESTQSTSTSTSTTTTANTTVSTGGVKRKSLTGPDAPNKSLKTTSEPLVPVVEATTSRLLSRVQAMTANQKRVSVANRQSWTSGGILPATSTSTSTSAGKALGASASVPHTATSTIVASASTTPTMEPATFLSTVTAPLSPKPATSTFTSASTSNPFRPTNSLAQNNQNLPPSAQKGQPLATTLPLTLARHNSVTTLVNAFEHGTLEQQQKSIPTPSKLPVIMPLSPSRSPFNSSRTGIARAIGSNTLMSPSAPGGIPRSFMRSPTFKSGLSASTSTNLAATGGIGYSTTPKGSPKISSKSILQALEAAREEEEEIEVEDLLIREVITVPSAEEEEEDDTMEVELDEVEKLLREKEVEKSMSFSLPAVLKDTYEEEEGEESREDDSDELVVEKGRGALASAMEVRAPNQFEVQPQPSVQSQRPQQKEDFVVEIAVKKTLVVSSPQKVVMPGSLMFEDEELDEGEDGGDEADLSVEIIEVVKKVPTGLVRKPSAVSMSGSINSSNGSSMYGKSTTSNGIPKVKSIQLAAAAAKKEQQEKERKQALKEERENIRLVSVQKKQEEERAKVEDERRQRAEAERKRRERDGLANSQGASKNKVVRPKDRAPEEEQGGKKRKVDSEVQRTQVKKIVPPPLRTVPSNSNLHASLNSSTGRSALAPHHNKPGQPSTSSSMIGVKYMNNVPGFGGTVPRPPPNLAPKANAPPMNAIASTSQSQNKPRPTQPKSEENYPELPDIESEYSDSGDEGYDEKIAARPAWAQSPNLADALGRQQFVNPDDIFGPIPALQMNEIFRTNSTRITKRTSSACWEGTDALTAADEANYNRKMGFKPRRPSTLRK